MAPFVVPLPRMFARVPFLFLLLATLGLSPSFSAYSQTLIAQPISEDADPEPATTVDPMAVPKPQSETATSTPQAQTPEEQKVRDQVKAAFPTDRHYANLASSVLAKVYADRGFRPLWDDASMKNGFHRGLANELKRHALPELRALDPLATVASVPSGPVDAVDVAYSIAFIDSALLIRLGAVPFSSLWPDWDQGEPPGSDDRSAASIASDLVTASSLRPFDMTSAMYAMAPKNWIYRELLKAYPEAKEAILKYSGLPQIPSPEQVGVGHPGEMYVAAPAIAAHLIDRGYLKMSPDQATLVSSMTPELTTALIAFQNDFGLAPDGVFGATSWSYLNTNAADRYRSISLNLHRARLMPSMLGTRYAIANLPNAELYLFEANDFPVNTMRIVHGKASVSSQQTKIFRNRMREVVFGPYWNVPPSIAKNELLPIIRDDWGYLSRNNYELVNSFGSSAGTRISPDSLEAVASGKMMIRQKPGDNNALGYVKFLFPNPFNIYMHDTPSRSFFSRANRDLSHGCIRVAKPDELAAWVFSPEGWTLEQVRGRMKNDLNKGVAVKGGINVYITYFTTFPRPSAGGRYLLAPCRDVYGRDSIDAKTLASVLPWQEGASTASSGSGRVVKPIASQ